MSRPGPEAWSLRRVVDADLDALHLLCCKPEVYCYLFDGSPPARSFEAAELARSLDDFDRFGVGMWVLHGPGRSLAGSVQLKPDPVARTAELSYLLDPGLWGRGLATRMAWTAIGLAFRTGRIDSVFAGADAPNARSFALMRRLGMRFRAEVTYPMGPGAEYVLHRDDPVPLPEPEPLPIIDRPPPAESRTQPAP